MRARGMASGVAAFLLAGWALGQPSTTPSTAPAALAQPRTAADQPIVSMRTAGQPDRQLKVLKLSSFSDGESIAEVQDVANGQVFSLPGKVVALLPKLAGTAAPTTPSVVVAPPIRPVPPEPKLHPQPAKSAALPQNDQPLPKVTFIPAPPLEPTPVQRADATLPPAPPPVLQFPVPGASLVWRPRTDANPTLAPTPDGKPDRWQPTQRTNPPSLQSLAPTIRTIARGTHQSGHEDEPPAVRLIRPSVVEEREELVPVAYRSIEMLIREETREYVYDLVSALRPSIRENAALCLAESRYGSRPEVKRALARAAVADPASSVRAKCIELLMRLGYHDPDYMGYLLSASTPGETPTMVKAAAKEALAKLSPR